MQSPVGFTAEEMQQPLDTPAHWSNTMPAEFQDWAKDFGTVADAKAAMERAKAYKPATSVDEIVITSPEGVQINQDVQNNFKKLCVEKGITPQQAQALASWEAENNKAQTTKFIAASEASLRQFWGGNFDANRQTAFTALTTLDRKMGGTLAPALRETNMHNHPKMIEALYTMGTMIKEDGFAGTNPAPQHTQPEKAIDAFQGMFKE